MHRGVYEICGKPVPSAWLSVSLNCSKNRVYLKPRFYKVPSSRQLQVSEHINMPRNKLLSLVKDKTVESEKNLLLNNTRTNGSSTSPHNLTLQCPQSIEIKSDQGLCEPSITVTKYLR